jgi:acyl carrier protein
MERSEVFNKLSEIFRSVFNNQNLQINEELTANDVDNWDSLTHMLLITEVESSFSIKFRLKELNKMRNVGDLLDMIVSKI